MSSNQTGGGPSKVGGPESREPPFSGHNIFAPWHSHMLVVRIAIYSPPSPTTRHGFRGHQKTASASVKHLRTVCIRGNENRTGMVLPPELVGLIDYSPTLSESVRRVVLWQSVRWHPRTMMTTTLCCRTRRVLIGINQAVI